MGHLPDAVSMLASVEDGVPTLKQLWVNAPCLLGMIERCRSANVGLMLGQCNRRQDNIKYT